MCLSIAINRPNDVLNSGVHNGFEWTVVKNCLGYRCGYIRLPKGHPWHGKHYHDIDNAECHGGLTFSEPDKPCGKGEDDAWWIGFDCAHAWDLPDPELYSHDYAYMALPAKFDAYSVVRDQNYVESECKSLCDQAAVVFGNKLELSNDRSSQ